MHNPTRGTLSPVFLFLLLCASPSIGSAPETNGSPSPELRTSIDAMKASPRGPFERIRWFCKDGTVLPPKAYACRDHGGGFQHGELNTEANALRAKGYSVANVYAGIDPAPFVGNNPDVELLNQLLMERFLFQVDDGWIFRGARSYRGALQAEDEEAGAKGLVLAMLADPAWLTPAHFFLLRESVRLFPLPRRDEATAGKVRHAALELAEKDKTFTPLRAKIHNAPDAGDAGKVRAYARSKAPAAMRKQYEQLAKNIDSLYASGAPAKSLRTAAKGLKGSAIAAKLTQAADRVANAKDDGARYGELGKTLAEIRNTVPNASLTPEQRLVLLETSLALEDDAFTLGSSLLETMKGATRHTRLSWLADAAQALYGIGFITQRHLGGVNASLARLEAGTPTVNEYRKELRYLARGPEWSGRWLEFNWSQVVRQWAALDPKAHLLTQDRLRGSPLLFYSAVIDGLNLDANQLAGIQHDLFGKPVGAGLRALNPGLARGTLVASDVTPEGGFSRSGIYLLPESTSDLPRVSGILTRGEGSSLSHVQLLARNLGIPNVVVGEEHVPAVQKRSGDEAVQAVSPLGVVQLVQYSERWDKIFGEEAKETHAVIRPDLEKLDLTPAMIPLGKLRSRDSGRRSGPKGANLGELKHHFGDQVPDGFVISFGVFRQLLNQPIRPGGPSTWDWMDQQYKHIATLSGVEKQRAVAEFLSTLREWILKTDPGKGFRQGLKIGLDRLGKNGTFGVFVRSDTNVEDLAGFTGAGLNLTLPNVVGYDNVLKAVKEVWASPFTDRAYGWRQGNMEKPRYVFPAVVVQKSFPSEKSGVLVTTDVDTGNRDWLTVAVSEGVGGAVEGQAAESLKINRKTGEVRYLAQATDPVRSALVPTGGMTKVPASGTDRVLTKAEIAKLVAFANTVGERFPALQDEQGKSLPADVEFGFRNGNLTLLQIRPLVESKTAQRNSYLAKLDERFRERGSKPVDLSGVPKEENQ
ncbi:MAG: PEP/pyruvate-binding domain-containing protein [Myxococcota bacterium]|jgi:hypothetical protein|nr:phosphoenolpyruvate synthase [Deltaproteobacteria bacterium]MCP4240450.1 phosphoenolpyruvate synthase [bacterium]MDP7075991.1 PEP/pyruvate-binding domain-containing protein [Myxococcota bacterium]MDP7431486.1 PEP/pyruvate-binding domain-containing protein [Myxococcota bacterium]